MPTETKSRSLSFYTTGEGMTNLIRDSWVSDKPKHALTLCREGMGMTTEQALEVITGKKKLIGDTREGDGTLDWTDDDTKEVCGIELGLDVMVGRIERKYVGIQEHINLINSEDTEFLNEYDIDDNEKSLNYYQDKLADTMEELMALYDIVGKSIKALPRPRSAKRIKEEYAEEKKREERMYKKDEPFFTMANSGKYYISNCSVEKCKKEGLHSGWLLPDGTFYGGNDMWIHRGILDTLDEYDFFKDKDYTMDEDSVQEVGNWIKVSAGSWMIWEHRNKLTKEQVEFIIQFTVDVRNTVFININSMQKIHVQVFAEILNGREFDSFTMARESESMVEQEKEKEDYFPSIDDVSNLDVLSTPFFVPDATFVKWLVGYANGRLIVDCGAGSGYLSALIVKHGGQAIAIEPFWTLERNMFWKKNHIDFHVFVQNSEDEKSIIRDLPAEKTLVVFARPCHNGFVERTIKRLPDGVEALYISHKDNTLIDLGDIAYTKLQHEGTSKDNEFVLSIK